MLWMSEFTRRGHHRGVLLSSGSTWMVTIKSSISLRKRGFDLIADDLGYCHAHRTQHHVKFDKRSSPCAWREWQCPPEINAVVP
jgi:hypothetical protein